MQMFFYYSGIVAWVALGLGAILAGSDAAIDWTVPSLWTKKMFLEFVWDRLKKKNGWRDPEIVTEKTKLQ